MQKLWRPALWWLPYSIILVDAAICVAAFISYGKTGRHYFAEGELVTWLNGLQLVAAAAVGLAIFLARTRPQSAGQAVARLWLLVAVGSLYLALDEMLMFHEGLGHFLDQILPNPPVVKKYGDTVLLAYGVAVVVICRRYWREFGRDRRTLLFFCLGTVLLGISEVIDMFFGGVTPGRERVGPSVVHPVREMYEESAKFLGFGVILAGLIQRYLGVRGARRAGRLDSETVRETAHSSSP